MERTVVALSTGAATSAIALLRLSGSRAAEIASAVFRPVNGKSLTGHKGYTASYGSFHRDNEAIDDGVVIIYRAPKSYTGEDMAELCCHGNPLITSKLLAACVEAGAEPAAAGEFTKRAFLNGKLDLAEAEAVSELITAESEAALRSALGRREGSLSKKVEGICGELCTIAATLGVWSDFPEEEDAPVITPQSLQTQLTPVLEELTALSKGYKAGALIERGITVAVVGSPNVGKSTLTNLLSGSSRSIVTEIAGTTRDVVEAPLTINGIALKLLDTAGIRDTEDTVEKIGVSRSKKAMESADLVLLVLDGSRSLDANDYSLLKQIQTLPSIVVRNKVDLPQGEKPWELEAAVSICAQTGEGEKALKQAILDKLDLNLSQDITLIASARQHDCVSRALSNVTEALVALTAGITLDAIGILVDEAIAPLLQLTGKSVTEAVTAEIFARFCVGK